MVLCVQTVHSASLCIEAGPPHFAEALYLVWGLRFRPSFQQKVTDWNWQKETKTTKKTNKTKQNKNISPLTACRRLTNLQFDKKTKFAIWQKDKKRGRFCHCFQFLHSARAAISSPICKMLMFQHSSPLMKRALSLELIEQAVEILVSNGAMETFKALSYLLKWRGDSIACWYSCM